MQQTLLLTDIVDSTALTQSLGNERMVEVWMAHDRAARKLLVEFDGREADRTDGFLMLFGSPDDAIGYAEAFHAALAEISERESIAFHARIGIHTGDIILIETSEAERQQGAKPLEVEGIAKPMAARIMSIALAGQTLLSKDAVLGTGKDDFPSLGHWQMKGVAEPIEVFAGGEIKKVPPGSSKVFQVSLQGDLWIPVQQIRNNLPPETDAFIGRESDLAILKKAFLESPLLTLMGPGGSGKSRLGRRYAWKNLHLYPGGIWWIDLTEARTKEGIEIEVAKALEILADGNLTDQIGYALAARGPCLIILDNFEQVRDKAMETLGRWMSETTACRFLVTSRSRLGLAGEFVHDVSALDLKTEAVALFSARAQNRWSAFRLTENTRRDVAIIVETLEGLPLAIELAAARTSVLSAAQIRERIAERFNPAANHDGQQDQSTLASAIDWSWNLLSDSERSALCQLSVFEGGFRIDAAEAVIDLSHWPGSPLTMDIVQHLVDKSLVRREEAERFGLFVSIQEYAAQELAGQPELEDATRRRHGEHYRQYGTRSYRDRLGAKGMRKALFAETDNLLSACQRAINTNIASAAAELLGGVYEALQRFAAIAQLSGLMDDVLGMPGIAKAESASITCLQGHLAYQQGATDQAMSRYQHARELAQEAGDSELAGRLLTAIGQIQIVTGQTEAGIDSFTSAVKAARELGDRYGEMNGVLKLSTRAFFLGRHEQSEKETQILSKLADELNDVGCAGRAAWLMGMDAMAKGEFGAAKDHFLLAQKLADEIGDHKLANDTRSALAQIYNAEGDFQRTAKTLEETLLGYREAGNRISTGITLGNIGFNYRSMGDLDASLHYFEEALAIAIENNDQRTEAFWSGAIGDLLYDMEQPDRSRELLEKSLAIGRSSGSKVTACLALKALGRLDIRQGNYEQAEAALQESMSSAKEAQHQTHLLSAQAFYGLLLVKQGHYDNGQALIDETLSQVPSAERTLLLSVQMIKAEVHALQGQQEEVAAQLDQARQLAQAMHMPMDPGTPLNRQMERIEGLLTAPSAHSGS